MKRGRRRRDGLDDLLPGPAFVREQIRAIAKAGARTPASPTGPAISDRDIDFIARYSAGETLQQIGTRYGITRERVRQRLTALGVSRWQGGASVRAVFNRTEMAEKRRHRTAQREVQCLALWGIPLSEKKAIEAEHGYKPFSAYMIQRRSAKYRGIAWRLSFKEWWAIWAASGKWPERGRGADKYCMARWADDGPYDAANAHICSCAENGREYQVVKKLRPKKNSHTGVYCLYPGYRLAWVAKQGKRYIGMYETADEAIAARMEAACSI